MLNVAWLALQKLGMQYYKVKGNTLRYGLRRFKFKKLGTNIQLGDGIQFYCPRNMEIGSNVFIGVDCYFAAESEIRIGSGSMLGPKVFCNAGSHLYDSEDLKSVPYDYRQEDLPIVIGENVWIGGNVSIAPGTVIGEGSVIGMGCVVVGNVPPCSVVVGKKGGVVKKRNEERYRQLVSRGAIFLDLYSDHEFEFVEKGAVSR